MWIPCMVAFLSRNMHQISDSALTTCSVVMRKQCSISMFHVEDPKTNWFPFLLIDMGFILDITSWGKGVRFKKYFHFFCQTLKFHLTSFGEPLNEVSQIWKLLRFYDCTSSILSAPMLNKDRTMLFLYIHDNWGYEAWKHNLNQCNTWVSTAS